MFSTSSVWHSILNFRFAGMSVLINVAIPPPLSLSVRPSGGYTCSHQLGESLNVESIFVSDTIRVLRQSTTLLNSTSSSFVSSNLYLILLLRWKIISHSIVKMTNKKVFGIFLSDISEVTKYVVYIFYIRWRCYVQRGITVICFVHFIFIIFKIRSLKNLEECTIYNISFSMYLKAQFTNC